jgi:glycosyltransferase involved in cell wall biosynthesis
LPNISRCGAYADFSIIAENGYFCFLYTSLFDGIPTVILEAAGLGLPIIAPDVSAIGEFVVDGTTGILLESCIDDQEMANAYVTAAIQLADDAEMRARMAGAAYDQVINVHSTRPYTKALTDILGVTDVH